MIRKALGVFAALLIAPSTIPALNAVVGKVLASIEHPEK